MAKLNLRTFVKFCKRHWKYVLGTAAAGIAISKIGQVEYDQGLKDAGAMFDAGNEALKNLPEGASEAEMKEAFEDAMKEKWNAMYE